MSCIFSAPYTGEGIAGKTLYIRIPKLTITPASLSCSFGISFSHFKNILHVV